MKILLINYEMGYGIPPTHVQGYSGKTYATSHFDNKYACHVAELEIADYNKAARDISRAWHLSMRRWVPIIPEDLIPASVEAKDIPAETEATEPKAFSLELPEAAPTLDSKENAPLSERQKLEAMHLSSLKKLARDSGLIEVSKGTREEIITALLAAHQ